VGWYSVEHQIIQCMGCRNICFRKYPHSEDVDLDGQPEEYILIYPDPTKRQAALDVWMLPDNVRALYQETLACLNSEAQILAAAGLRAVVEATCIDQGCTAGNLKSKIDGLVTNGLLGAQRRLSPSTSFSRKRSSPRIDGTSDGVNSRLPLRFSNTS
jgi:hypothetical protein